MCKCAWVVCHNSGLILARYRVEVCDSCLTFRTTELNPNNINVLFDSSLVYIATHSLTVTVRPVAFLIYEFKMGN